MSKKIKMSLIAIIVYTIIAIRWGNMWPNAIAAFGFNVLSLPEFWINTLVMIILFGLIGNITDKFIKDNLYQKYLLVKVTINRKLSAMYCLYTVGTIMVAFSIIISIFRLITNLTEYGFGWMVIFNFNISFNCYIISIVLILLARIVASTIRQEEIPDELKNDKKVVTLQKINM